MNKALDELIDVIKDSNDYKKCIEIKEKLGKNENVERLVNEIKEYQKRYVRENDEDILKIINSKTKELESIPIYNIYLSHLEKVNEMIDIVKDELNKYFDHLVNSL